MLLSSAEVSGVCGIGPEWTCVSSLVIVGASFPHCTSLCNPASFSAVAWTGASTALELEHPIQGSTTGAAGADIYLGTTKIPVKNLQLAPSHRSHPCRPASLAEVAEESLRRWRSSCCCWLPPQLMQVGEGGAAAARDAAGVETVAGMTGGA